MIQVLNIIFLYGILTALRHISIKYWIKRSIFKKISDVLFHKLRWEFQKFNFCRKVKIEVKNFRYVLNQIL